MNIENILLMRFEWVICFLIIALLIIKLTDNDTNPKRYFVLVNILLGLNVLIGFFPLFEGEIFSGFFRSSHLIVFEKNALNIALLLISLTAGNWLKDSKNATEFYILLLSSMLGIFTMLSGGHILMLYLGLEMSTIPLAALANFNTNSKKSSEAGIKLILSSAFSTGILLFGISLLYAAVGDLSYQAMQHNLHTEPLTILAFVLIFSGFAFKMSVVPFHLWTADVYEGSPVVVTNYLSAISKASVIMVILNFLYQVLGNMQDVWLYSISILAILSMTIGNLFALRQNNIKRLLAFSSIAQVGFVLVGIAGASKIGASSVIYFTVIYIISTVASFAVVDAVSTSIEKEDLNSYKSLYKRNPFYAIVMAVCLFSLAGIPPTAGFFGKLFLLTAGLSNGMYILLAFAAVNLVISLYNYMRVVKVIFIDETNDLSPIPSNGFVKITLVFCIIVLLSLGFITPFFAYINSLL